ncbi:MAG: undecaprenyl-phosphate galactose phosphotransferase WbaP [Acidaminococcaceae bacterium]|jgi:undecaprenyl-phosphate galactose phosphotransferase|nr:undecaprenyl-phosphate galactose phosphotransferase WbaP [Acidaminococcaceae bacterium]MCI2110465.1 undecaprenyl-phosphate galactose phosphotransferase WbaP [Acidaminococcaceae bacterium]
MGNSFSAKRSKHSRRKVAGFWETNSNLIMPFILAISDWLGILCAENISFYLRNIMLTEASGILHISWLNSHVTFPFAFMVYFQVAGLYRKRMQFWQIVEKLFAACVYGTVTIVLLLYVTHIAGSTSRLYVALLWVFTFLFVGIFRYIVKKILEKAGALQLPVLLIGAGKTANLLVKGFSEDVGLGYRILGVLDDNAEAGKSLEHNIPYLGTFDDAEKIIRRTRVKDVVIAAPGLSTKNLSELIYRIQPLVKNLSFVPDLIGLPVGGLEVESLFNEKLMLLNLHNNLAHAYNRVIKFVFDMVLTVVGTICISPILLLLIVLIKHDSPGPVIFAHRRIGRHGKYFMCYKFRTMCIDAQNKLEQYLKDNPEMREEWEKDFKLKDDPRITRIGHFLRKTSLDELPQIFNVLKGDMSLVGPRPIIKAEVPRYGDYINDYFMVRPGITGMWQVNGRSDTTYDERVGMDSWYVRNWAVWLDVMLLFRTFKAVFKGKGAY